jgi:hypothetical protein
LHCSSWLLGSRSREARPSWSFWAACPTRGDLPMLNQLVCPAHGGCDAIGDLVWRLTDD